MATVLDIELQTYEVNKKDLISKANGKYVLVKGDKIIEIYESQWDAIHKGYEKFGSVPFLVRKILEQDLPIEFTSNLIIL